MMLTLENITAAYGAITALRSVSLTVQQGEIVTLIGANGAGKSTLLVTLCGKPQSQSGSIRFLGEEISRLPTDAIVRRGIAQAPEGRRIFPRMTVFENLQLGALVADKQHFAADLERVYSLFPRLKERTEQRGGTLSGGEHRCWLSGGR